jgi:hypothetical protein
VERMGIHQVRGVQAPHCRTPDTAGGASYDEWRDFVALA